MSAHERRSIQRRLKTGVGHVLTSLLLAMGLCTRAAGCSVVEYRLPTNYELVQQAGAIVVAKVVSLDVKKRRQGVSYGTFRCKVIERIKGDFDGAFIPVEGDTDFYTSGDPDDFSYLKKNQSQCHATDYRVGGTYVLFLEKWQGRWIVDGPPFTRTNMLVSGRAAPWAQAVRQYARIAALGDYEKAKAGLAELRARAERGEAECPRGLVADIDRHFAKPTPPKSFADLKALYDNAQDDEVREDVFWAIAKGKHFEAKPFIEEVMNRPDWTPFEHVLAVCVRELQITTVRDQLVDHIQRAPPGVARSQLRYALQKTCGQEETPLMVRLLAPADPTELKFLGEWFAEHQSEGGTAAYRARLAGDYLNQFEAAFFLAAMGDPGVVAWAREFLKKPGEKQWIGAWVVARSPLPEADLIARELIRHGDSHAVVSLVQGYAKSPNPQRWARLRDVMALPQKGTALRIWLRRTLQQEAFNNEEPARVLLQKLPPPRADEKIWR